MAVEQIKPLTELMAQCARCGSSMDHPRCDGCDGEGVLVYEDDEGYEIEEECEQCCDGFNACCLSSAEWCEANPLPGREDVVRHTVEWFEVPLIDPARDDADSQRFHDENHEPGHPLPMRWQDCDRCRSLDRTLS